ncbi:crossover junction endodeoxyribonuclease RuvC [Agrococcus sp. ARC_14]|uniref:crossover junction endodeoxyribonuclease RuvC n=1 Tax=Agrococcus sp. ARC_14 TaxID=2919927 RepID=UPI001F06A639|nr:crossover junction endodeoxyribonuclease RuvC [Agrococcus sp. ARC_14]MCH1883053.1 crossover junction endodeoxyribonuclease RuvC [Agrococcus sp. ARC_14]
MAASVRVLGVDPGLTRCGVGVVDVVHRTPTLVHVEVLRSDAQEPIEQRLLRIARGVEAAIDAHRPDAIALERVFAQSNLRSVMGVAQISGIVLRAAAERGIPISLLTPTEVKAAVTGYGAADKRQVGEMVRRLLRLEAAPKPADAADALAIAIAEGWRAHIPRAGATSGPSSGAASAVTPAQRAWAAAESAARSGRTGRR